MATTRVDVGCMYRAIYGDEESDAMPSFVSLVEDLPVACYLTFHRRGATMLGIGVNVRCEDVRLDLDPIALRTVSLLLEAMIAAQTRKDCFPLDLPKYVPPEERKVIPVLFLSIDVLGAEIKVFLSKKEEEEEEDDDDDEKEGAMVEEMDDLPPLVAIRPKQAKQEETKPKDTHLCVKVKRFFLVTPARYVPEEEYRPPLQMFVDGLEIVEGKDGFVIMTDASEKDAHFQMEMRKLPMYIGPHKTQLRPRLTEAGVPLDKPYTPLADSEVKWPGPPPPLASDRLPSSYFFSLLIDHPVPCAPPSGMRIEARVGPLVTTIPPLAVVQWMAELGKEVLHARGSAIPPPQSCECGPCRKRDGSEEEEDELPYVPFCLAAELADIQVRVPGAASKVLIQRIQATCDGDMGSTTRVHRPMVEQTEGQIVHVMVTGVKVVPLIPHERALLCMGPLDAQTHLALPFSVLRRTQTVSKVLRARFILPSFAGRIADRIPFECTFATRNFMEAKRSVLAESSGEEEEEEEGVMEEKSEQKEPSFSESTVRQIRLLHEAFETARIAGRKLRTRVREAQLVRAERPLLGLPKGVRRLFTQEQELIRLEAAVRDPKEGVERQDRWWGEWFSNCFLGNHLVTWIMEHCSAVTNRSQALAVGQAMMQRGVFHHVDGVGMKPLVDAIFYYRFTDASPEEFVDQELEQMDLGLSDVEMLLLRLQQDVTKAELAYTRMEGALVEERSRRMELESTVVHMREHNASLEEKVRLEERRAQAHEHAEAQWVSALSSASKGKAKDKKGWF